MMRKNISFAILRKTVYACLKDRYTLMFILCGLAFSFKLQEIFALPFLIILYAVKKKFSILNFAIMPAVLILTSVPGIIMGRIILDPFRIYREQVGEFDCVSLNYNSFWNCVVSSWPGVSKEYREFKAVAVIFTIVLLGMILLYVIKHDIRFDLYGTIGLLHITVYTCVLFLPSMHERYSFIYEITAIMLLFFGKKYFFPGISVILLSCVTYGHFLFGLEYPALLLSVINVGIYGWYVYQFMKEHEAAKALQ